MDGISNPGSLGVDPSFRQRLQGCSDDVLEKALREGKQTFINTLYDNEKDQLWTSAQTSIQDIVQAVKIAQDKYSAKRNTRVWKWLTQLSARISVYGSILDVMVQHHPEYAALVWGTMKFLFIGVENHEESVHQLSKALCRIADCLPRQELKHILYPTIQMQEAVAKLYAHLIQFMVHAMRWYQKSRSRRAIGAILKPFALDFQDQLDEVYGLSKNINEIANTAAQAELRAVHTKVEDVYQELSLARLEIKHLGEALSLGNERSLQIMSRSQSLSSQVQLDIHSQSAMIRTVQLNQIMSAPFMSDIPSSGKSLNYCSAIAQRHPQYVILPNAVVNDLRGWSEDINLPYLIIETPDSAYGKALLLSLLQQIQNAKRPAIWALRFANFLDRDPCVEDILRILLLHALEVNSDALALQNFPITLASLRAASSQEDWLVLLDRALAGLDEVYIIIDPDLLRFSTEDNTCTAADVLLALQRHIHSTRLKIIVLSFGINKGYFAKHSVAGSWKAIRANNEQRQRMIRMKQRHLTRVRKMRSS
ncbi:unnamed protein product [Periconia digitata]|uniref:DUF7708 domain-containing protein n=1 Tax=Periconia digitata TaxID=1303443 RepID=A0A9W4U632_9PLEO|nr:unnamed protein product [Periconia digitata]